MRFIARLIQRCICRYARRVYATGKTPRWYQRWLFRFEGWLEYEVIRRTKLWPHQKALLRRLGDARASTDPELGEDILDLYDPRDFH